MKNILFAGVALLFAGVTFADSNDLSGTIFGPDRQPLEDATVYVYTAGMKEGTNPLCPSCYADCAKRAKTDAAGRFAIPSLDERLQFRILVVAEGHSPLFVLDVDPSNGEMNATLGLIPANRLAPEYGVRGRIVDPNGSPVVGATVEFLSISLPELRQRFISATVEIRAIEDEEEKSRRSNELNELLAALSPDREKIDALVVTDEQGEFLLTSEYADATYEVMVRARGLAPELFGNLRAGKSVHERKLDYGVTASGVVDGSDLALDQVLVGIVQVIRTSPFYGDYVVGVNEDGRFEFPNLPPQMNYYVYGKMESLQGFGVIDSKMFRAGMDDSWVNLGTLNVAKGLRVGGRVILPDGVTVPPKTNLMFNRSKAWDTFSCELAHDGRFEASDVPAGRYSISIRIPGYRMSKQNYSLDPVGGRSLIGAINEDYSALEILMEIGEINRGYPATSKETFARHGQLRAQAIRGYESD